MAWEVGEDFERNTCSTEGRFLPRHASRAGNVKTGPLQVAVCPGADTGEGLAGWQKIAIKDDDDEYWPPSSINHSCPSWTITIQGFRRNVYSLRETHRSPICCTLLTGNTTRAASWGKDLLSTFPPPSWPHLTFTKIPLPSGKVFFVWFCVCFFVCGVCFCGQWCCIVVLWFRKCLPRKLQLNQPGCGEDTVKHSNEFPCTCIYTYVHLKYIQVLISTIQREGHWNWKLQSHPLGLTLGCTRYKWG